MEIKSIDVDDRGQIRWMDSSAIRKKEFPQTELIIQEEGEWFSANAASYLNHSLVTELSKATQESIRFNQLVRYQQFTDQLELELVIPVSMDIANGRYDASGMGPNLKQEARLIIIDEATHSYIANGVIECVGSYELATGSDYSPAPFIKKLDSINQGQEPSISRFVAAFVSETLITGNLLQIPKDLSVKATVRQIVRDHAQDEARHHRYFGLAMDQFWYSNKGSRGDLIRDLMYKRIIDFVVPDRDFIIDVLRYHGMCKDDAEAVFRETFSSLAIETELMRAAEPTIQMAIKSGIIDESTPWQAEIKERWLRSSYCKRWGEW